MMFDKAIYRSRRERLKEQVGRGLILLLGNEESSMNYKDNCYPFRQDSTFLYFFGIDRAGLVAIIDIDDDRVTIYGDDISVEDIIWTGPMESLADHAARSGVAAVEPKNALEKTLKAALVKADPVHFLPPYRSENRQKLSSWLDIPWHTVNERASVQLIQAVVAQRSIKSPEEIKEIEKAVDVTVDMQLKAAALAAEGMSETVIAGIIHGMALSAGGDLSFPTILTVNGQILHNHSQGNILQKGKMLLCDCGAETAMHYAGDLTRTFPVGERYTARQKEIYEVVLQAHMSALAALRPGVLFRDVHLLACEKLAEGLKNTGLMKGEPKEAVAQGAHALFFQCGLGHPMGLDTHDMEDLGEENVGYTDDLKKSTQFGLKSLRLGRALEAGFVMTVEPGIYFIPELIDWWKREQKFTEFINYDRLETYKDFGGIRIEEDLLITKSGSRVLGKPLAREASSLEAVKAST